MYATLPSEVLWLILTYFLNEEHERSPSDGEFVLDHHDNPVPNQLYDAAARQDIVIVWKLVCKAFNEMCPSSIKSPLIGLCDTIKMLTFVHDAWNPDNDSHQSAELLSKAIENSNDKLQPLLPTSIGNLHVNDLSIFVAALGYREVLKFFEAFPGRCIGYQAFLLCAIRADRHEVIKYFLEWRDELDEAEDDRCSINNYLIRAIVCGKVNAVRIVHEAKGGLSTNESGEIDDPAYRKAIPKAAHYGHLDIVKLLHAELGYEMNKDVTMAALQQGHMHVAEYANQVPSSRCTVGDMMSTDNPNWTQEKVDGRDPEYLEHYDMSAFEHVTTYTLERAQDKWHRAQQFAGKLTGARASAGPSAERRMEIMREKQRFREAELAKRAAKAQKTER